MHLELFQFIITENDSLILALSLPQTPQQQPSASPARWTLQQHAPPVPPVSIRTWLAPRQVGVSLDIPPRRGPLGVSVFLERLFLCVLSKYCLWCFVLRVSDWPLLGKRDANSSSADNVWHKWNAVLACLGVNSYCTRIFYIASRSAEHMIYLLFMYLLCDSSFSTGINTQDRGRPLFGRAGPGNREPCMYVSAKNRSW